MRYIVIVLFVWCVCSTSAAVGHGVIRGTIYDAETREALRGVIVRVENTALGTSTSKEGTFILRSVPAGKHSILVSMIGYSSEKKIVTVKDEDTVNVEIRINPQALQSSEVVVTASKRVQAVQDVPISISTVDARAIQQRNVSKLDEILRYVPGVTVSGYQVSIRGSSGFSYGLGSRAALLLDNFPLLSADNGDMSYDALPMFDVERIEVVKGAGSALYGTSALGGVINVLTRDPKDYPEFRFRSYSGLYTRPRFDSWLYQERLSHLNGFDASYSQKIGSVGWILSGGMKNDDSYRQYNDSFRWNLFNKVTFAPTVSTSVNAFMQYAYEDRSNWLNWYNLEHATQPPPGTNLNDRVRSKKMAIGGEYKQILSGTAFAIVRSSFYRTWYENNVGKDQPDYVAADARQFNTEVQYNTQINERIMLTAGANYLRNDVNSPYMNGDRGQYIFSLYAQGEFSNVEDITVTLGARTDIERTFGESDNLQLSPKFGISYKVSEATQLRMSVGRAFRAASIAEKFAALRFAGFTVGRNLNLQSEKSWSFEIGGQQSTTILNSPVSIDAALFQNEMYDLIEPQFVVSGTKAEIQFVNVTRARIQGLEIGVKGWVGEKKWVGIESSLLAMSPRDLTLGQTLRFRHNLAWTSRLLIPINPIELQMDYRYLSRVESIDERIVNLGLVVNGDVRVPVHVVDARLIWDFQKSSNIPVTVSLNVRNLFDYYYVETIGNLGQTRQISLQFDAKM